jgi:hypothetical protein
MLIGRSINDEGGKLNSIGSWRFENFKDFFLKNPKSFRKFLSSQDKVNNIWTQSGKPFLL